MSHLRSSQKKRKENDTDPELAKKINENLHRAIRRKLKLPPGYVRSKQDER